MFFSICAPLAWIPTALILVFWSEVSQGTMVKKKRGAMMSARSMKIFVACAVVIFAADLTLILLHTEVGGDIIFMITAFYSVIQLSVGFAYIYIGHGLIKQLSGRMSKGSAGSAGAKGSAAVASKKKAQMVLRITHSIMKSALSIIVCTIAVGLCVQDFVLNTPWGRFFGWWWTFSMYLVTAHYQIEAFRSARRMFCEITSCASLLYTERAVLTLENFAAPRCSLPYRSPRRSGKPASRSRTSRCPRRRCTPRPSPPRPCFRATGARFRP